MQPGKKKQQRKNLRLIGSPQLTDTSKDLILHVLLTCLNICKAKHTEKVHTSLNRIWLGKC